ncbi:DUF4145 domain-containing protein [Sesbania bispinosa]|nr:DUF4145 domain-containing protein [Sesbania bispinosa]
MASSVLCCAGVHYISTGILCPHAFNILLPTKNDNAFLLGCRCSGHACGIAHTAY